MPGRERQRVIKGWIDDHKAEDETPLDYICNRLSDGAFLQDISAEISRNTQYDIPQHAVRRWLIDQFGQPEVLARFSSAREDAADVHVADAWRILEEVPEVREALDRAKQKVSYKLWLAERGNRERYGPAPSAAVNVNLSVAELHLSALRNREIKPSAVVSVIETTARDVPAITDGD